jgi:hypothetical protein
MQYQRHLWQICRRCQLHKFATARAGVVDNISQEVQIKNEKVANGTTSLLLCSMDGVQQ